MMTRRLSWLVAGALLLASAPTWSQDEGDNPAPAPAPRARGRRRAPPAPAPAEEGEEDPADDASPRPGSNKAGLEAYLKQRRQAILAAHKARMDFIAAEADIWNKFWVRVRDERNQFELRIARQRLDFFESLGSLEASSYALSLGDFEKLQGNMLKSFEAGQKAKLNAFFAEREARWKEFALNQERDRAEFAAQGDEAWQSQKAGLRETLPEEEAPPSSKGKGKRK
jgi:hypothetical protein